MKSFQKDQIDAIRKVIEDSQSQSDNSVFKDGVLIIKSDEKEWFGLTSKGLVVRKEEGNEEVETITDPRFINVIALIASQNFKGLESLKPERKMDDPVCQFCNGTGDPDTSIEEDLIRCYCGGLGWLPKSDPEVLEPRNFGEFVPIECEYSEKQHSAIAGLSIDQIRKIDSELIRNCSGRFRKVAMVVMLSISALQKELPHIPDLYYAGRVRELVEKGELESTGDLSLMRRSEIRIPRR